MLLNSLVTIAIPTYKRLNYLQEAVASALNQTYSNIEVVISQDLASNGLDSLIENWCNRLILENPRVRYQSNSTNLGLAGNWNACVDAAKGEYIVIIGDDDRLLPNFVETLLSASNSDAQVIFSNHYLIDSQGKRLENESYKWTKQYHRDCISLGQLDLPEKWVWQNSIPMSASLIKTKYAQRLRFKEDLNTPEIELFLRIAQEGGNFFFVPEYLAEYRTHEQSETAQGHYIDRLVKYLSSMPVSKEIEPYKQNFISGYYISLVHKYLLENNWEKAQKFFYSSYHPQWQQKQIKVLIQSICISLPPALGCNIYRLISLLRNNIRTIFTF